MKTTRLLLAMAGMLLLSISCKKDKKEDSDQDDTAKNYTLDVRASAVLMTEQFANEMEFVARYVRQNIVPLPDVPGNFLNCATITRTNTPAGKDYTITFSGAPCSDGQTRSGVIVVEYNATNHDTMIRLQNYKEKNVEYKGDISFGYVTQQNVTYLNIVALNTSIIKDNQTTFTYTLSKKSVLKAGGNTNDPLDDAMEYTDGSYFLNGKIDGTNMLVKGTGLKAQLQHSCNAVKYLPISGQVKVEYSMSGTSADSNNPLTGTNYLTFGDGNCGDKPYMQKKI